MSFPQPDSRGAHISAQNQSSGGQYIADGGGNQNVTTGGTQYNDHRGFHSGMPSVWPLVQALDGPGNLPSKPTRVAVIDWLRRNPDLAPIDIDHHHDELSSILTRRTGGWVLDMEQYKQWKDESSSSRLLLMHGKLGSGKTMLVSHIIKTIKTEIEKRTDAACIYFYFHEGIDEALSTPRIWISLLEQLLRHMNHDKVASSLRDKFHSSLQGSTPLRPNDCFSLFTAQAGTFETVYLILDGLDNLHHSEQKKSRRIGHDLIKELPKNIRVLFTARSPPLTDDINVGHTLHVTPRSSDLEVYVKARLDEDVGPDLVPRDSEARKDVIKKVTKLALDSEMFLLARLHLDELSKKHTLADINDALGQLPASLLDALSVSIKHIKDQGEFEKDLAEHILTWVVHAKTHLKVEQLQDSFAMQRRKGDSYRDHRPSESSIINVCSGLVVFDQETETLRLIHDSVQDYLRTDEIIPEQAQADLRIAKTCLEYLLLEDQDHDTERPLLSYAANHWYSHLGSDCHLADSDAKALIVLFLESRNKLVRAFKVMNDTHDRNLHGMTGLHAAVFLNLRSWVEPLIQKDVSVNAACEDGQTAAHWAVIYGRRHLLSFLISKSANLNLCDNSGDTPLHKALVGPIKNLVPIVAILAEGGALVDIPSKKGLTAMSSAIRFGPTSIAEILIVSLENIDAEITEGWTSLREVIYHAHGQPLVDKLEKERNNKDNPSAVQCTPLRHAFQNHARRLIDLLLLKGASLNTPTTDGWLPLIHAVQTGSDKTLRRLLERQPDPADVNLKDLEEGRSPLWWAFYYGNLRIITLLLEYKADINERAADGWTPLIAAVKFGNPGLVWMLISLKAQLDEQDQDGRSALHYALERKGRDIAWLLITHGANPTLQSKSYPSFIHLAIKSKDLESAWLLRQHGTDPDVPNDDGSTLLHQEVTHNNVRNVRFLLDIGANTSAKDRDGCTPLHRAVIAGSESAVALVASRVSPGWLDVLDGRGNCALVLAVLQRNKFMLQTLLRQSANCEVRSPGGLIALHYAASLGFNDGIQLLLRHAENVNCPDDEGYTAVHHAVHGDEADEKTLELLAAGGSDLEARERNDMTPLMLAVGLGKEPVVSQLLHQGVDPYARHTNGWTAIDLARDKGHFQMVRILERVWEKRPARRY